jgi:hypothetical protein
MQAIEDVFNSLSGIGNIDLVDVVKLRPGGDGESGRGHLRFVSFNLRDCSNVETHY